jgi:hypothetical protein
MKIAYIFHGHARTWETCYQSFFDNIFNFDYCDLQWDLIRLFK